PGVDTASYSARTNPVTVTLDGLPNDGEAGENDLAGAHVANATGAPGLETPAGATAPNSRPGGAGGDTLGREPAAGDTQTGRGTAATVGAATASSPVPPASTRSPSRSAVPPTTARRARTTTSAPTSRTSPAAPAATRSSATRPPTPFRAARATTPSTAAWGPT